MKQEGLLRRVLLTSVAVAAYVAVFLLALGWLREAVSFTLGAALSIGVFSGTAFVVQRAMTPEEERPDGGRRWFRGRGWVLAVGLGKWFFAGYLIWLVVRWPYAHIGAFLAGAGIVQAVLFLKALGQMLADRAAEAPGGPRSRGGRRPLA